MATIVAQGENATKAPSASSGRVINIGTRRSPLARAQTDIVVGLLKEHYPTHTFEIHAIQTMGDKNQVTALHEFNAKALWTYELEVMLLAGELDFIVHSLKDIPTQLPAKTTLGPVPARADPRDALILHPRLDPSTQLDALPAGSVIGTSSVRRSAQLTRLYPHLKFQSVRGSVGTRLAKLDADDSPYAAIVLAAAGLLRTDLGHRISWYLSSSSSSSQRSLSTAETSGENGSSLPAPGGILHAVGQGGLGIQLRSEDSATAALLGPLKHRESTIACLAERSLMRTLEGGCSVPIGVETEWKTGETLEMRAIVVSLDGSKAAYTTHARPVKDEQQDADAFGFEVAQLLIKEGAGDILKDITLNRKIIENQGDA